MKDFKLKMTLTGARAVYKLIKLAQAGEGTSFVGSLVLKNNPTFLKDATKFVTKEKLSVTGTNGKTTTSGIIYHVLEQNGRKLIANRKGANMLTGTVNAFALTLDAKEHYEHCVLECDEAYLAKIQSQLPCDYLLVTNLFRDQLDRYGELDTTKRKIQEGINQNPDIQLILNADDPLVSSLKSNKPAIFYGIRSIENKTGKNNNSAPEENFKCPCGNELGYSKKFYAHQGHYFCECGYKRPIPDYEADIILEKDFSIIKLGEEEFKVPLIGLFNAYNALASIAMLKSIGITDIAEHLLTFKTTFGRSEVRDVKGHKAIIQLIKNPAGANEVLKSVDLDSDVLIIINDNYADGRDISWLWDADFENLANTNKKIVVSGIRAEDMAVRLKYAGIPIEKITVVKDLEPAIDYVISIADNNITILPTYTALLNLNKLWKKF